MAADVSKLQHEERELRARLSLAEANLHSFFVNLESAFPPPTVVETPSDSSTTAVFAPDRVLVTVSPLAHTVLDQEVSTNSTEIPRNSSEVTFPPTFVDPVITLPSEPQRPSTGSEVTMDTGSSTTAVFAPERVPGTVSPSSYTVQDQEVTTNSTEIPCNSSEVTFPLILLI